MKRNWKLTLVSLGLLTTAVLLQSSLLQYVAIRGVKPDLYTIILVFIALRSGSMVGQFSGFTGGLLQDIISLPPLGFYSLIHTVIGYGFGFIPGSMFANPLFIPILFVFIATIIKGLLTWLIALVFSVSAQGLAFFGVKFWIEVGYNSLLAPFIFALLNLIKLYKVTEREEV